MKTKFASIIALAFVLAACGEWDAPPLITPPYITLGDIQPMTDGHLNPTGRTFLGTVDIENLRGDSISVQGLMICGKQSVGDSKFYRVELEQGITTMDSVSGYADIPVCTNEYCCGLVDLDRDVQEFAPHQKTTIRLSVEINSSASGNRIQFQLVPGRTHWSDSESVAHETGFGSLIVFQEIWD